MNHKQDIDSGVPDEKPPQNTEPAMRCIPMPADTIADNYVSAGWLLSQMDLAGGIYAYRTVAGKAVTVALNAMSFHKPVFVGDEVSIYASTKKIGRTSLVASIDAWARRRGTSEQIHVTEGDFAFVHIDENRNPRVIGSDDPPKPPRKAVDLSEHVVSPEEMQQMVATNKTISIRTVPMPRDTNYLGDIFGGWILAQMDMAGLKEAQRFSKQSVVTVGIQSMEFQLPVFVGDEATFLTEIIQVGSTSVTIKVECYVLRATSNVYSKVTEGLYSYVAVDEHRKPVLIK